MSTTPPQQQPIAPTPAGTDQSAVLPVSTTAVSDLIDLPTGKELDEADAQKLEVARSVRLVVVAGPVGCGKTTLLTSLYELFQWGPVSGYFFAGSSTLPAFERRCYFSRTASERSEPDTERTPFGEVRYLHLRVCPEDLSRELDFLFTDVSGETFERARDSTEECQHLTFLHQAHHFLLLLDSEKLIVKARRWEVAHDSMTLLRSCLDSGMLAANSLVSVLWTKFDYFEAASGDPEHTRFLAQLEGEIRTEFGARTGRLSFSRVAARPTQVDGLKFGHGLPELFAYWASASPYERPMDLLPTMAIGYRESELFASRHFSGFGK